MSAAPQVLIDAQQQIQNDLQDTLNHFDLPSPLKEAVYHAVMLGGKRIRPALCYGAAQLKYSVIPAAARRAAVAVELIHCYSLTHDDLPCMDDDELRRGQPTCHVQYGQATALLAGDILQSMAFEVLGSRLFAHGDVADQAITLRQMQILATASSKMVCGQVLDLQAEGRQINQQALENVHRNKTGALIQAAIMLGAVTAYPVGDLIFTQLRQYGQALGLAFQVQDDILDITSETAVLGKTAGKDQQVQKSTYPALMGLQSAQDYATQLHQQAESALASMPANTQTLAQVTDFLLHRQN
ncbi:(2E,6E)-farnesyl diphosphate synthase [Acinetobacter qingfengensis]|uniref:(2E,6E)-farnesyl diphosphate synthase n=1 Tax=Acinetobacter qingfengensis TaxID=1262585 RepID=A0A1E7RF79_9GAMM|nr:farnesyl diphosphate synthase [Acinetobacter qingfengensis]KAA8731852.1 (2E,6E)-farnesyl diphosphate synthase [Acinetobacter qingfengensis]OEY98024.1 (2E,6E)-farnesyl diphosphate synthase [Acinetobacter qingfengensis]